jgi:AcrR family transcriptional regulator
MTSIWEGAALMRSSSAITKKREVLSRDVRIQSILQASQRVFSSRPYDDISIDDIAAEASMSKGLLYHYFVSKRDLYLETLRSVLATIGQIPEECPDLRTCLHAFFGHFEHSPALAKMVLRGGIGSDAEAEALLTVFHEHQFALFSQKVGTLTPLSPLIQLGLRGWIRFFQEVCLQWVEHQDIPREQVIDLLEYNLQAILSWPEQQR